MHFLYIYLRLQILYIPCYLKFQFIVLLQPIKLSMENYLFVCFLFVQSGTERLGLIAALNFVTVMSIFRKFTELRIYNLLCMSSVKHSCHFSRCLMLLYAVVLLKVWGCCVKFSKFCHGELASLLLKVNSSPCIREVQF